MGTAIRNERQRHELWGASATGGLTLGSGERRELPPPLPAIFSYIQIKSELIFGHRCVSIRLQRWENRDKSGTPSQKRDKWASRDTSLKIGTIPENPGMLAVVEVSRNALEGRSVAPKFVPLAFRGP